MKRVTNVRAVGSECVIINNELAIAESSKLFLRLATTVDGNHRL
jgi:hypothetical protein